MLMILEYAVFSPMHAVASTQSMLSHNIVKEPIRSELIARL